MAKNDIDKSADTTLAQRGLGLLERAWSTQWTLRLVCAVLFLDMAMMLRVERGLWQWSAGDMELLRNVGWLSLVVVSFSLSFAIVMPVLLLVLRQIGSHLWYALVTLIPPRFRSNDGLYQRGLGYVPAHELLKLAMAEKDDFLLRLYEKRIESQEAARASRDQAGELTAAATVTALLDWTIDQRIPESVGLIGAAYGALGSLAPLVAMAFLFSAASIVKWAWFTEMPPAYIYYPLGLATP